MAKGRKPTPREIYWDKKNKEEREKAALLPAGFVNHGNTCFMNSVLQGLVATRWLEDLIQFQSQEALKPSASQRSPLLTNGRGPEDIQQDWVDGMALGDAFIQILERSWRMRDAKERSSMSPRELVSRLGEKYDQYLDFRQQDAHEFLLHLLDGMRMEEFDIIKQRQPPPPPKPKSRSRASNGAHVVCPEPIPEEERLTPFVDMTFGGKLASVLVCETCKHVSHTYEEFDDLSLSINHDESKERMRDRLRTFASKFKSSTSRTRDQSTSRPTSFSQPPSPPLSPTTLDLPEDTQEAPRRRSLEVPSSLDLSRGTPKVEIFANFISAGGGGGVGELLTHQPREQLRKVGEAGLGKLGRRISAGMALSGRKDRKASKVDQESRIGPVEEATTNGKGGGADTQTTAVSAPTSGAPSRQQSPGPMRRMQKEKSKPRKLSEHDSQKAAYLQRLLHDPTANLLNPLAVLRAASPMGVGISPQWTRLGSVQGIEDCLKMFTAVEALDGDNMFGCRNCWKIANGQLSGKDNTESDTESESSEDDEKQAPEDPTLRPEIVRSVHSFSIPTLPPGEDVISSSLPPSSKSTPPMAPVDPPILEADVQELDSLAQYGGLTSESTPSLSSARHSQTTIGSRPPTVKDSSHLRPIVTDLGAHDLPVPTITAISPPPDVSTFTPPTLPGNVEEKPAQPNRVQLVHFQGHLDGYAASSRDSLQLPSVHTHRRRDIPREGDGNASSDDSEYDDTSGISDGDGSVVSVPSSVEPLRPAKPRVPRSKQVVYRRALKRYLISSAPPILVVHLKRFQQVSKSPVTLFGNLKKLDEYVSFPEYLDIRPFLAPKKEDYGLGRGEMRGKLTEKGKRVEDQPCVYRLYAVVVHIGNMLGGHYIGYTALRTTPEASSDPHDEGDNLSKERVSSKQSPSKADAVASTVKERQWCYISDTVVRLATLDEVLKSKAYICMYERLP